MPALVEAVGLSKQYGRGGSVVHAVSKVAVSIDEGEYVAIRGRSGSGKSTLMNLLGPSERPDCDRYTFAGRDVTALGEDMRTALRNRKIGFVFQLPALLRRSMAVENVELPLLCSGIRGTKCRRLATRALARVGLSHRARHMPSQLSGGEQQRVVIARALVNDATLILADEPTGALDSRTSDDILSLFEELNRAGRTIVVVTHGSDVAQRARRRITLHDGRVVEDDGIGRALP